MRSLFTVAVLIAGLATSLLLIGCGGEEVETTPTPTSAAPKDPGWPTVSVQDAAIEFDLEEAHYHIRKARYAAPDSYGSQHEMPLAAGYVQRAHAMQIDRDTTVNAADHLVLEHGSEFDVPYGWAPRCKWCRYPMPKALTRWPLDSNGEKVIECPRCGAREYGTTRCLALTAPCRPAPRTPPPRRPPRPALRVRER